MSGRDSNRLLEEGPRSRFFYNFLGSFFSPHCQSMTSTANGTGYSRIELEESCPGRRLTSL